MKCQEFQNDLAEYAAGRLPALRSAEMQAHARECGGCTRDEAGERALRDRFALAPAAAVCPDVWPQLVSRRQTALAGRSAGLHRFALGSALAACAVCVGFLRLSLEASRTLPPVSPAGVAQRGPEATEMLQMVTDIRSKPLEASDALLLNIQTDQNERSVLLGSRGPE
jgi:anti-sigma factor RsiW